MAIGIVGSEEHIKKIEFKNPEIIEKEEEYKLSFFKCPFRSYSDGDFKPCYEHNCMAFRSDKEAFWCALIEAYRHNPKETRHPIEMLGGDDDW